MFLGDLGHLGCRVSLVSPRVSWVTSVTAGVLGDLGHLGCLGLLASPRVSWVTQVTSDVGLLG